MVGLTGLFRNRGSLGRSLPFAATALALLLFGLAGCTTQLFDTISEMVDFAKRSDRVPPQVSYTTPSTNASGIFTNTKISITFSEPMDPASINASTILVSSGGVPISGTVSYAEQHRMALFAPTQKFLNSTTYAVSVTTGAKDLDGNKLEQTYSWLFQTTVSEDISPPVIVPANCYPVNGATLVSINTAVYAKFNEALDPTSVGAASLELKDSSNNAVSGSVTYIDSVLQVIFTPDANLKPNELFTATVKSGVRDLAGIALAADYSWSFTTAAGTDTVAPTIVPPVYPGNENVDVAINENIVVEFSEFMNGKTINTSTFSLLTGGMPVQGAVSYNTTTNEATFNPMDNLHNNTLYTVVVTTGITDAAGNSLSSGLTWSFMTKSGDASIKGLNVAIRKIMAGPDPGTLTSRIEITNTDPNGDPVSGLTNYHVRLEESPNGTNWTQIPIASTQVVRASSKSVAILIDNSGSMSGYISANKAAVTQFISQLEPGDKGIIGTFIGDNPFRITFGPYADPTTDKVSLGAYINSLQIVGYPYTFLWDGVVRSMQIMAAQRTDITQGLEAVICLTDADTSVLYDGIYNLGASLAYSYDNDIPIWSIAFNAAAMYDPPRSWLQALATSGYFYPTTNPNDFYTIYNNALASMNVILSRVYTGTWHTNIGSGNPIYLRATVTFSNANGSYTVTSSVMSITVP